MQYNQQRIKLASEQVKEILVLLDHYRTGQGKRTDLTSINVEVDEGYWRGVPFYSWWFPGGPKKEGKKRMKKSRAGDETNTGEIKQR